MPDLLQDPRKVIKINKHVNHARNAFRKQGQKANDARQAIIDRVMAQHQLHPLNFVTWRTILRPGWKDAMQRLLPYTALALLIAPFTTVQSESWCLARHDGDSEEYLAARNGLAWDTITGDATRPTSSFLGPWSARPAAWGNLAFLPRCTILNLLFFIHGAWVAYHIWYESKRNLILPYDKAVITAALGLFSSSAFLAVVYGLLFYFRASAWDWRPAAESAGLTWLTTRAPDDRVVLGPGLYCAFASPCVAALWLSLSLYRQRKAAKQLEKEEGLKIVDSEKG